MLLKQCLLKLKKIFNNILKLFNLKLVFLNNEAEIKFHNTFELYQYIDKNGNFDYEAYRNIQIEANKNKLDRVWANEENIEFLSKYILTKIGRPQFGLCHGTRRGLEQKWFRERLNCEVIGTEISETAREFPHTIEWDFHEIKSEWIKGTDFIYSNAFDHSYDPEKCLNAWISCLSEKGLCIIEYLSHKKAKRTDPFGTNTELMPYLVLKWGKGNYCVKEIIEAPIQTEENNKIIFLIIQKNKFS